MLSFELGRFLYRYGLKGIILLSCIIYCFIRLYFDSLCFQNIIYDLCLICGIALLDVSCYSRTYVGVLSIIYFCVLFGLCFMEHYNPNLINIYRNICFFIILLPQFIFLIHKILYNAFNIGYGGIQVTEVIAVFIDVILFLYYISVLFCTWLFSTGIFGHFILKLFCLLSLLVILFILFKNKIDNIKGIIIKLSFNKKEIIEDKNNLIKEEDMKYNASDGCEKIVVQRGDIKGEGIYSNDYSANIYDVVLEENCVSDYKTINSTSNNTIKNIYDRLIVYLENEKPFLKDNCQIDELAKELCTNTAYLSKTINIYTGLNFSRLMNKYRVAYSIDLFKNDIRLKVSELSSMSGFRNTVSYNMSFKYFMNTSPSDWCRCYRDKVNYQLYYSKKKVEEPQS